MLINERHETFSLLFDPKPVEADDTVLVFQGNEVLLRATAKTDRLPQWGEIAGAFTDVSPRHAFTQGNRRFLIADANAKHAVPSGFAFEGVRAFRTLLPSADGAMLSAAYHLSVWYAQNRFCGACGGPTRMAPVERALTCDRCKRTVFPSILPAVIVAVTDGGRLLLAQNAHGAWRHFSLIAGYVEVGETAEQAVKREVLEETGLRVKNVRYIKSQPWGFSQSLMLGFSAELDGPDTITLQTSELAEARWFSREEIPHNDSTASIAFDLMERFRRGTLGGRE